MSDSAAPHIQYRPDLDILTVRWPTQELRAPAPADYEALLLLPAARRTHRWLLDVCRRPYTSRAVVQRVLHNWLARTVALLPGPLRLAYLLAPTRAQELDADAGLRAPVPPAPSPGSLPVLQTFTDEGEAVRWLLA